MCGFTYLIWPRFSSQESQSEMQKGMVHRLLRQPHDLYPPGHSLVSSPPLEWGRSLWLVPYQQNMELVLGRSLSTCCMRLHLGQLWRDSLAAPKEVSAILWKGLHTEAYRLGLSRLQEGRLSSSWLSARNWGPQPYNHKKLNTVNHHMNLEKHFYWKALERSTVSWHLDYSIVKYWADNLNSHAYTLDPQTCWDKK